MAALPSRNAAVILNKARQVAEYSGAIRDPAFLHRLARGEDASFQNKIHLTMDAKGFGPPDDKTAD